MFWRSVVHRRGSPLALGDGAQTISLIYRPTEWMEKTPTIDFLLVFDAEADLKSDRGFSYAYTRGACNERFSAQLV